MACRAFREAIKQPSSCFHEPTTWVSPQKFAPLSFQRKKLQRKVSSKIMSISQGYNVADPMYANFRPIARGGPTLEHPVTQQVQDSRTQPSEAASYPPLIIVKLTFRFPLIS